MGKYLHQVNAQVGSRVNKPRLIQVKKKKLPERPSGPTDSIPHRADRPHGKQHQVKMW